MSKNCMYKIAKYEIGITKPGAIKSMVQVLRSHLQRAGLLTQVSLSEVGNEAIEVYIDPVVSEKFLPVLQKFEQKQSQGTNIRVKLKTYQFNQEGVSLEGKANGGIEPDKYYQIVSENNILKDERNQAKADLDACTNLYETAIIDKDKEITGKQKEIEGLMQALGAKDDQLKILEKRTHIQMPSEILNLQDLLNELDRETREKKEKIISQQFYMVAEEIGKRAVYEETEEIKNARETLKQRDEYLKTGRESFKLLPKAAREMTEKEWKMAEEIAGRYDIAKGNLEQLQFPVRIAKYEGKTMIILPVTSDPKEGLAKTLYDKLTTEYAVTMQAMGCDISIDEKQPFAALIIDNKANLKIEGITEKNLFDALTGIALQANLRVYSIKTDYFAGVFLKETKETAAEMEKSEENPINQIISSAIRERYAGNKEKFCKNAEISQGTLDNILSGRVSSPQKRTLMKLAEKLGIDESRLRALFQKK